MCCAALGGKMEIPSIDGSKIELKIDAGAQSDQVVKIKGQGMTFVRSDRRGDLFVKLRVETPVNLSSRQKELLEEFRSISKEDTCQPESKSFFDKIKDLFAA
jgi:molecular chaperone DnaJ